MTCCLYCELTGSIAQDNGAQEDFEIQSQGDNDVGDIRGPPHPDDEQDAGEFETEGFFDGGAPTIQDVYDFDFL